MTKEFIPYKIALDLKELGFDEPCFGLFDNIEPNEFYQVHSHASMGTGTFIKAPLYQQAFRWFREKYNLNGVPTHKSYEVWNTITDECFIEVYPLSSQEEAELACLIKLIEIVKNK